MEIIKCVQEKSKSKVEDYKHEGKGSDKVIGKLLPSADIKGFPHSSKASWEARYLSKALEIVGFVHGGLMNRDHSDLRNSQGMEEYNDRALTEMSD